MDPRAGDAAPAAGPAPRELLAGLEPTGPPRLAIAREATAARAVPAPAIGILAGSFNPLTNAHIALAQAALTDGGLDALYFALSRQTVDKEGVSRPTLADRALVLARYVGRDARLGLLLTNRGLYAEQAVAARAAFPHARELCFVVGFDKAVQIFDPRYYADRDAVLHTLFDRVTLLVAPRGVVGAEELLALLDQPANRPFRDRVRPLPFDPAHAGASSTLVRARARAGQPVDQFVPPETASWLATAQPYAAGSAEC